MEALSQIQPIISLVLSLATLIGIVIAVYKFSRDPDIKTNEQVCLLKQSLELIADDVKLIKVNHLAHLEANMNENNMKLTKLFTILEERLPRK